MINFVHSFTLNLLNINFIIMRFYLFFITICCLSFSLFSQNTLPDSCKLIIGTNLSGVYDWGAEQPFVDMMRSSREWYSKDDSGEFNSGNIDKMSFRPDGYPTHIPQFIPGFTRPQFVATIWGRIAGWELGDYFVFYEGNGDIDINFGVNNYRRLSNQSYAFNLSNNVDREIQLIITRSDSSNPVKNIRIIHKNYENTYQTNIFNPHWINYLKAFKTVRFMDWGHTNHWSQKEPWIQVTGKADWNERAKLDYYTWTTNKGIPYEIMIQLMNEQDLDGWVCIPHRASDDYIRNMAALFKANVESGRHMYVEYSNEIWNWIFGQAVWLSETYCKPSGVWPECIVPNIQNALDIWTAEYGTAEKSRITRILGIQTGWHDVSNRMAHTMNINSFDAIAPTYYFGISEKSDSLLDDLGSRATVADIATAARLNMGTEFDRIKLIQTICTELNKKMIFYEGGHHLTAHPFGVSPTYELALNSIHRDTAIFNLYNEWFTKIRSLQTGKDPLQCMNFSFISGIDGRYGSWGILESVYQDLNSIPAPKYNAVLRNQYKNCITTSLDSNQKKKNSTTVYFDSQSNELQLNTESNQNFSIYTLHGQKILSSITTNSPTVISFENYNPGVYIIQLKDKNYKIIKN